MVNQKLSNETIPKLNLFKNKIFFIYFFSIPSIDSHFYKLFIKVEFVSLMYNEKNLVNHQIKSNYIKCNSKLFQNCYSFPELLHFFTQVYTLITSISYVTYKTKNGFHFHHIRGIISITI